MMNKLINPILFIMCLLAMACSDNNNENETFAPFSLEKRYYEVRLERNATSIPIINGSGDISLAIEDENILNAIYSKYNDNCLHSFSLCVSPFNHFSRPARVLNQ